MMLGWLASKEGKPEMEEMLGILPLLRCHSRRRSPPNDMHCTVLDLLVQYSVQASFVVRSTWFALSQVVCGLSFTVRYAMRTLLGHADARVG